jgi:hypothetical protein
MSTKKHKENEKEILKDFFENFIMISLNTYYECVDEYTDKGDNGSSLYNNKMPDFYLRSNKKGLPDLAIEIKTLQRDYDRPINDETGSEPKEYCLSIKDFHVILKLNLVNWVSISPKAVRRHWNKLEKELSKYKRKLEDILDRINEIEKILENEDQEKCIKDLSNQKKEELKIIFDYIKSQDEKFLKEPANLIYLDLYIHAETSTKKIKDVKVFIQNNKEKGIRERIKSFLEDYFEDYFSEMKKQGKLNESATVKVDDVKIGDCIVFTVKFIITWKSEDINFHIEKIEKYIKESEEKFKNLKEVKSNKSDESSHLEVLFVKGMFVTSSLDYYIEKLKEGLENKLKQKNYKCLLWASNKYNGIYLIIYMSKGIKSF